MKRNLSIIRRILNNINTSDPESFDDIPSDVLSYHEKLCTNAGFTDFNGNISKTGRVFIDMFKNDDIWNESIQCLQKAEIESVPVDVMKNIYDGILMQRISQANDMRFRIR